VLRRSPGAGPARPRAGERTRWLKHESAGDFRCTIFIRAFSVNGVPDARFSAWSTALHSFPPRRDKTPAIVSRFVYGQTYVGIVTIAGVLSRRGGNE